MNAAQLKAQIDAAATEAYKRGRQEGARDAVDKARAMMPTILANAYKQAVLDTAGFFQRELFEVALKDSAAYSSPAVVTFRNLIKASAESGELPEMEVKTPDGVEPMQRVSLTGPERYSDAPSRVDSLPNAPFRKVSFYNGHEE